MRLRVSARMVPLRSLIRLETVIGETPAAAATSRMVTRPGGAGFCNRRLFGPFTPAMSAGLHDSAGQRCAAEQGLARNSNLNVAQIGLETSRIHLHAQARHLRQAN